MRTVFLDRDGVLNQKLPEGQYVTQWSEFHLLPGVPEAIRLLNRAGLRVLIVSNQRGIALGLYTKETVLSIHAQFQELLESYGAHVDGFYFCPHAKSGCRCRKPLPGLFEQALADFPTVTPDTSVILGDSLSDIEFGRRLGMRTIFLEGDELIQKAGADEAKTIADLTVRSLSEAVQALLRPKAGQSSIN